MCDRGEGNLADVTVDGNSSLVLGIPHHNQKVDWGHRYNKYKKHMHKILLQTKKKTSEKKNKWRIRVSIPVPLAC